MMSNKLKLSYLCGTVTDYRETRRQKSGPICVVEALEMAPIDTT